LGSLAALAAVALTAAGQPLFNDAATIGQGHLVFETATRFGMGFAGYDGGNGTGPAMGQSVDLAWGATSFLQLGLRMDFAYNGDQCTGGNGTGQCFIRPFLSGGLKVRVRIGRFLDDRIQLGAEVTEAAMRLPGTTIHAGFDTTVAAALSAKWLDGRVLGFLRAGYDYKHVLSVGSWSDGPVFTVGAEGGLGKVHPFLEASLGVPKLRWQDGRGVVFCFATGMTATFL
jgi:hypothetical protein